MTKNSEHKPGYKFTSLGWIPKDWELMELDDFAEVIMGQSPEGSTYNTTGDGVALINGPTEFTDRYPIPVQWTTSPTKICKKGDILICVRGSSTGRLNIANKKYCIGRGVAAIRAKRNTNYSYLEYQIANVVDKILTLTSGSTFPNIDGKTLRTIEANLPSLSEQKAIAKVLSTWDKTIEITQKLIKQKELRKKFLMQQLLTGKKQLNKHKLNGWTLKSLSELLIPVTRPVDKPKEKFLALGIRSHGKGTFLKPEFEPSLIDMDILYEVKENDLIVNITFAWEGAIAVASSKDEGALVSHRFPTYLMNPDSADVDYFKYVIIQPRFTYLLGLISPGGAGRNRVLSRSDFLNLEINIPPLKEQIEIGKILRKVDAEISIIKDYLDSLKEQKKGLMQILLTGKKRLNCDLYDSPD